MKKRHRQSGLALMMVLVLVASASVLALGYVSRTTVKLVSSGNLVKAGQARYLGESGLYQAMHLLRTSPTSVIGAGTLGPYTLDSSGDSYTLGSTTISSGSTSGKYLLTGSGTSSGITQTVTMKVESRSRFFALVSSLNPIHWWWMGDSGGTAWDRRGINHGDYVNGAGRSADGAIIGDTDRASLFDGVNDHIDLIRFELSGQAMTLMAWVRLDSSALDSPQDATIISKADGSGVGDTCWMLGVKEEGGDKLKLLFRLKTDEAARELKAKSLGIGQWFLVTGVYDGSEMKLYHNGEMVDNRGQHDEIYQDSSADVWIGGSPAGDTDAPWFGQIDEVVIFNHALSAEQIKALYESRWPDMRLLSWD